MASQINASNSGFGGIVSTGDSSGVLQLQTTGTTALTIDTSQNVGIGTASPTNKLHVKNSTDTSIIGLIAGASYAVRLGSSSALNAAVVEGVDITGFTSYQPLWFGGSQLQFSTGNTERMRIDSSGRITTPYQPAFFVNKTTQTNLTATDLVVTYDNITTNIGSCYNSSNGRFTAPIAGFYQFSIVNSLVTTSATTYNALYPYINGSSTGIYSYVRIRGTPVNGSYGGINGSFAIYLNASDYIQMYAYSQTASYLVAGEQIFSGYLIG